MCLLAHHVTLGVHDITNITLYVAPICKYWCILDLLPAVVLLRFINILRSYGT